MHAACPIQAGTKMAISLWIRSSFQDHLMCSTMSAGYDTTSILRNKYNKNEPKIEKQYKKRPEIPQSIFKTN